MLFPAQNFKDAWIEQFNVLSELQKNIDQSHLVKAGIQLTRNKMITYWNKMTPSQQREIACRYLER